MQPLDSEIHSCTALLIDGNPTSRSILAGMLRDFGLRSITQTSRIQDARRQLETRGFDLVLCDYHFEGADYNAQDLLEDLRRAQLLPYSTVFIMVTGEASYAKVAEAAESALDSYLLKPHTAGNLADRVVQARQRKRILREIFEAMEAGDFDQAARLCLLRFQAREKYWLYAARIGAELLLRLGQHDGARKLYEAVTQANALPWARLGVARAHVEAGQLQQGRRTLETLIAEQPGYADAYDVMGRVQVEAGELEPALETYRKACTATPFSLQRLQKLGMLAFYMGRTEDAAQALGRAQRLGASSRMFDAQSLVMLALLHFEQRDSKALQRCRDDLAQMADKAPDSARLQRFVRVVSIFKSLLDKQLAEVVSQVKQLAAEIADENFDFEAACNLCTVLARLSAAELQLPDGEIWMHEVALRFCGAKSAAELLASAASPHLPYADIVRDAQQHIATLAEQSMSYSLAGQHADTVKALLLHGSQTRNAKLIDMARLVWQRHKDRIDDASDLGTSIDQLHKRYCSVGMQASLGQAPERQAGGLSLRAPVATPGTAASAAAA